MGLNEKHFKILKKKEFEDSLLQLLIDNDYLDPETKEFTEKATKSIKNVQILPEEIFTQLEKIWDPKWTNTFKAVSKQYQLMCSNNIDLVVKTDIIVTVAKYYLANTAYAGELKYFFWKDNESRFLKTVHIIKNKKQNPTREIKDRIV